MHSTRSLSTPSKCVLLRDGQPVPLTPKAFEILLALVRHPGRVLTKEELFQLVWPDAFVEENNLPRNVSALRKALGEEPTEHKFVMTVPGQGYRFVASVRELQTLDEGESLTTSSGNRNYLRTSERRSHLKTNKAT